MNLIIDIGNTRAKLAVFRGKQLLETMVFPKENLLANQKLFQERFPDIENGIVASVAAPQKPYNDALSGIKGTKIRLSAETPVPFINAYKTPETLGLDRMALAAAAVTRYPKKNVLIIDAGTCITYDIIEKNGHYRGGAISPGLNMRFRALNNFTANLPLLRAKPESAPPFLGQNTEESLILGVTQGLVLEMDGFIAHFRLEYTDLTVILTGGDSQALSKRLKNGIFAAKNFLLSGLNAILEYNLH